MSRNTQVSIVVVHGSSDTIDRDVMSSNGVKSVAMYGILNVAKRRQWTP